MATSQPYTVACDGGLVKASNQIDLLKTPGVLSKLITLVEFTNPPSTATVYGWLLAIKSMSYHLSYI